MVTQGVERVYCEMNTRNCGNITGGWMRAAYIDMTDVNNTCPQGLIQSIHSSKRMCTRSNDHAGCSSITFSTHNLPYTKVCGRARGYQFSSTDGFGSYTADGTSLNSYYLDGLSITYGTQETTSGALQPEFQKTATTVRVTVHVLP